MARRSRLRTTDTGRRKLWLFLIILLVAITGAGTLYKEQLANIVDIWRETFPSESEVVDNVRGTIYDRNFKELARTLERVSLYVRPRDVWNIEETAEKLSEILGLTESEIVSRIERDSQLVWLQRAIGQEDEDAITRLNLPGVYLHREVARAYPQQENASQLIGYSEKNLGLAGVEHYYNRLLSQDRVRQEDFPAIDLKGLTHTTGRGHDLVLTLDMKIQAILEKYVRGLANRSGGDRISSLLLDTDQGRIIAGASYPTYNPNKIWQGREGVLDNLLLTPMVVPDEIRRFYRDAALLQGGWEQGKQVYPWSLVSAKTDLGSQLRLFERLQLTTKMNVDFSGGKKLQTDTPRFEKTRPGLDYGAIPATAKPLKVLLGMAHLLNGGKKIQPHILNKIMERPGQKEFYYDAFRGELQGRNVLPSLVSEALQSLLLTQGRPGILGSSSLCGETVSLVPNDRGGSYVRDRMAITVIPARNPEMILFIVARDEELQVLPEQNTGVDGLCQGIDKVIPSMVALQQVYWNVADMVEMKKGVEHNFQGDGTGDVVKSDHLARILEGQEVKMPDLIGLSLRKGLRLLQGAEIEVTVRGTGRIVSQSPEAGNVLEKGDVCILTLAIDRTPENVMQIKSMQTSGAGPK